MTVECSGIVKEKRRWGDDRLGKMESIPTSCPNFMKRWPDILAAVGFAVLASFNLSAFIANPAPLQAGLFLFNLIVMTLFILRRPARARGSRSSFWLAVIATCLPILALKPAEAGFPVVGVLIQNGGLVLMLLALVFLNRSFGIAPAHRGLVTHGLYRLVRHPLYAAEMIHVAGYCLGYASVWNGVVWMALLAAQLLRIQAEERLLSRDAAYRAYQRQVLWQMVPGVW